MRVLRTLVLPIAFIVIAAPPIPKAFGQQAAEVVSPGLEKLDKAITLKLSVERLDDLENIIELCQEALDDGIPAGHQIMAKQLMSSTLYERAAHVVGPILDGKVDGSWMLRRKTAIEDLERAARVNPDDGEVALLTAQLHELPGGEVAKGRKAAGRAVELLQEDPARLSKALSTRATFQEDVQSRLADYDAAIKADKTNADAWRERGRTKLAIGDAKNALDDFRHLLESDQNDVVTMQAMGEAMASLGQYDEALETLDELIEKTPDQSVGYAIRARVRMAKGDLEAAEEDLNAAIKIDPRDLIALMMRTRLRMSLNNLDLALSDANRVLELRPGFPQAILLRSLVHSTSENYSAAISDLKRLLRRDNESIGIRLQLASIYAADGRPRKAVAMFTEILEQDPSQWEALRGRGDASLSVGAHAEAVADYDKVMELEPGDSGVLNNLAWVLATSTKDDVRNGERSIEIAKKACEATDYKAPHIISTLAAAYAETGDFEKAIEWSTKAVDLAEGTIKEQLRSELESYQQKKPWRELQEVEERTEASETSDLKGDLEDTGAYIDVPRF